MKKHTFKDFLIVTRYWSFAVSAMPVIATFAYLCSKGAVPSGAGPVVNLILALLGTIILHAAGNIISDYFDYKKGVDNKEAYAVRNLVFGEYEPKEYLLYSIIMFVIGITIGIVLFIRCGLPLLLIGMVGVVLTAAYSFLKYRALGDLNIFIVFSILIILGTTCAVTGSICPDALVLALPIGIITVSVLHANNTLDINTDSKAGIKTFAMLLGGKVSCRLYQIYMVIPFICVIVSVIAGWLHPLCLLSLIAFIPALKNIKTVAEFKEKGTEVMIGMDQASSKLQIAFSGLMSLGLFISALF